MAYITIIKHMKVAGVEFRDSKTNGDLKVERSVARDCFLRLL